MRNLLTSALALTAAMAFNEDLEGSNAGGGDGSTTGTTDTGTTDTGTTDTGSEGATGNTATDAPEVITRPKAGTMSGLVWDTADALYKARVEANFDHPVPLSSEVSAIYMTIPEAKDPTCRAQFARWVRFNGFEQLLKDRKASDKPVKAVDPEVAAAKAAKKAERDANKAARAEKKAARVEADKAKAESVSGFQSKIAELAKAAADSSAAKKNEKNEADSKTVPENEAESQVDPAVLESMKKRNAKNK